MDKPIKKTFVVAYDFGEVMDYVENKYGFEHRSYKGIDFWHWLLNNAFYEVRSMGSAQHLGFEDLIRDCKEEEAQEILEMLCNEFGKELTVWVAW